MPTQSVVEVSPVTFQETVIDCPDETDVGDAETLYATGTSTVKLRDAGLASTFPAASLARTSKVWLPSVKPEYDLGDEQAAQLLASRRHSNVEPDSLELNPKLAEVELTVPEGPEEMVVSGGVVSVTTLSLWLPRPWWAALTALRWARDAAARQLRGIATRSTPRRVARWTRRTLTRKTFPRRPTIFADLTRAPFRPRSLNVRTPCRSETDGNDRVPANAVALPICRQTRVPTTAATAKSRFRRM
jgi:hypothetical protein